MHPRETYPLLNIYFGAYLNQDWMYDYRDPNAAFEAFATEASSTELTQALVDFDQLLGLSDVDLTTTLDSLSTNLDPRADYGWDEREWLESLRHRVRAELEKRQVGSAAAGTA